VQNTCVNQEFSRSFGQNKKKAISGSTFNLRLAKHIMTNATSSRHPVRLVLAADPPRELNNNIDSVTSLGIAVEVGPLTHGTFGDMELYEATRNTVKQIMDFIEKENKGENSEEPGLDWKYYPSKGQATQRIESVTAYVSWKPVNFPVDPVSNTIRAVIHPSRLQRDFEPIKRGDPLFLDLTTNEVTRFDEDEVCYPIFIAEPAYFASGVAMVLTRKKEIVVY